MGSNRAFRGAPARTFLQKVLLEIRTCSAAEAVCERKQDSTGQLRVEENSLRVLGTRRGRSENPPSQARGGGEKDTEMERGDGFRTGEVEGKRGA